MAVGGLEIWPWPAGFLFILLIAIALFVFRKYRSPGGDGDEDEPERITDEDIEAQREVAGLGLELLHGEAHWLVRRKESVKLRDEETLHRRLSIDFELPPGSPVVRQTAAGEDVHAIPLFLLAKAPARLTDFDLKDENGTSLPLPTLHENASLSAAVLELEASAAFVRLGGGSLSSTLKDQLRALASELPGDAQQRIENASGSALEEPLKDQLFRQLARTFVHSSLVAIPLRSFEGTRKILKLSYDMRVRNFNKSRLGGFPRLGWRSFPLRIESPFIGARSYHFEAELPAGLEFTSAAIYVTGGHELEGQWEQPLSPRVHLYVGEASDKRAALAELFFRVERSGFVTGAVVGSALVTAVLTLLALNTEDFSTGTSTSAPALLLLLPSAIVAYVSRPLEHVITTRLLYWARQLLILCGLFPLLATARLVIDAPSSANPVDAHTLAWAGVAPPGFAPLAIAAGAITAILLVTRLFPLRRRVPAWFK